MHIELFGSHIIDISKISQERKRERKRDKKTMTIIKQMIPINENLVKDKLKRVKSKI